MIENVTLPRSKDFFHRVLLFVPIVSFCVLHSRQFFYCFFATARKVIGEVVQCNLARRIGILGIYVKNAESLVLCLKSQPGCWCYKAPLLHFITLHRLPHSHRGPLRSGASSRTCACLMQRKGHDLCLHTPDKTKGPEGAWKKPYLM